MKKMKRIIAMLLCGIMMLGALAGCQNQNDADVKEPNTEAQVSTEANDVNTEEQMAAFYNTAIKIGYTESFKYTTKGYAVGSGDNAEQVIYFFDLVKAKFPNAEFVKIEDENNTDAIIAANLDVVFGLNTYSLQKLKAASALKEYSPEWASEVAVNLNDDDNMYSAIAKDMIISVYRTTGTVTDSADVPKHVDKETFGGMEVTGLSDVSDLWKEGSAYIGKYELDKYMNDWNDIANKTFLVGLLSKYVDSNAADTDYVSAEGWAALQAMLDGRSKEWVEAETQKGVTGTGDYINNFSNTVISIDAGSNAIDKMAWYWSAGKAARLEVAEYGAVPTYVYGVAITNTTANVEAAQLFVDYIGSVPVVTEMAKHVRTLIPANMNVFNEVNVKELDENGSGSEYKDYTAALDADGNTVVRIIPTRQYMLAAMQIEAQDIDWDVVSQYVDAWVARANEMTNSAN